jgi:hypothetical protein
MGLVLATWCLITTMVVAAPPPVKSVDLSGTWTSSFTLASTGLSLQDLVITLKQSGKKVDGTLLMPKFRSPVTLKGTFIRGKLHLVSPPTRGLAVTLDARVKDPDRIKGTAVLDYDSPSLNKRQDRTVLEMSRRAHADH